MDARRIPQAREDAERAFVEHGLTERERDAARSVLAGMTATDAASVMGIDSETVASYRRRAYHKLGVEGSRGLVDRLGKRDDADATDWRPALLAHGLSETQAEALARVAAGRTSSEIAKELNLAAGTVSSARANGYRLLGVHSREEMVATLKASEKGERTLERAPRRRRASRLAAACVATAALLAVAIAGWQTIVSQTGIASEPLTTIKTEFGDIPNVVGMKPQEGWETLVEAGYLPVLQQARTADNPGAIVEMDAEQLPSNYRIEPTDPSGSEHPELANADWRAKVILSVSGMREIPAGLTTDCTERAACEALEKAGFTNVETDFLGDIDHANNRVVASRPAPGAWSLVDEPIVLTVTSDATVPDVLTMSPLDATSAIIHAGLTPDPKTTEWEYLSEEGTPYVVSIDPMPGETARVGDVVHITYNRPLEER